MFIQLETNYLWDMVEMSIHKQDTIPKNTGVCLYEIWCMYTGGCMRSEL